MTVASRLPGVFWAFMAWGWRFLWRTGSALLDLWRRCFSWLLGVLLLLFLLGAMLGVREGYRIFALKHGLRDLAAHSHDLVDEAVLQQARKRALRLGFMSVLGEEDPLEVAMEQDEDGFPLRCVRVRLRQPVELWGWVPLDYPLEFQVREVIRAPRPPSVELE